jgi:NADH:ubiquinone oxidoreductase subunit D
VDIAQKTNEINALNEQRDIIEKEIDVYSRNLCRGKSFHECIKILQVMPDTVYRSDLMYFLRQIHFDDNNQEITEPNKIIKHFKKLCKESDLESSIAFLDEMRSDIDKSDLILYFKNNK